MNIGNFIKSINQAVLTAMFVYAVSFGSAYAGDPAAAQAVIESTSSQVKARLQDPAISKDFRQLTEFVHAVIYPHADFDLISQLVLGKQWKEATPGEKDAFKKEFQTLLLRTYARAFVEFKDWSIRFLPVSNDGEDNKKVTVKTEVIQPSAQPIAVNYKMLDQSGEWKVYDIQIEGVSLVTNYRTSFKSEIEQSGSLQKVIDQLAKRNAEALASSEIPPKN
jgi:phospholipid transport system substrate-binding protein